MIGNISNATSASFNTAYSRLDNSSALKSSVQTLSSGVQATSAQDDPAGGVIAQQFAAQNVNINQSVRNLNDGITFVQTTESALHSLSDNTKSLHALSAKALSNDLSTNDRETLQDQADALTKNNFDIVNNTQFNGQALLQGGQFNFQLGPYAEDQLHFSSAKLDGSTGLKSIKDIDLSSADTANASLLAINSDSAAIATQRVNVAKFKTQVEGGAQDWKMRSTSLSAEKSSVAEADYAAEMSKFTQENIRNNAGTAIQVQAGVTPEQVLSLLR